MAETLARGQALQNSLKTPLGEFHLHGNRKKAWVASGLLILVLGPVLWWLTGLLLPLFNKPGLTGLHLFLILAGLPWALFLWGLGLSVRVGFFSKPWWILSPEGVLDQRPVGAQGLVPWAKILGIRDRISSGEGRVLVLTIKTGAPQISRNLLGPGPTGTQEILVPLKLFPQRPQVILAEFKTRWEAYGPYSGAKSGAVGASQAQGMPPTRPSSR